MSSTPQRSETHVVDLTREQRWVVHHVLVTRADESLDREEAPPEWLVDLLERIEADAETITDCQARKLADALSRYADAEATPDRDIALAIDVAADLEASLDA